jgi:hypothetical protein
MAAPARSPGGDGRQGARDLCAHGAIVVAEQREEAVDDGAGAVAGGDGCSEGSSWG